MKVAPSGTRILAPGHGAESVTPLPAFAPAGLAQTEFLSPRTLDEACALLAAAKTEHRSAVVLAGGTDWVVDRHLADPARAKAVDLVVDVTGLDELREVRTRVEGTTGDTRLVLGGGVTYWMLRQDTRVASSIPMLARMACDVGAVQIQTRGTLAGNLATASPAADGVAALMALEGIVTMTSTRGARRVPVDSFFLGYRRTMLEPDEVITAVDVRVPRAGARVRWQKVGTRLAQAISKVALASMVEVDGGVVRRARFGMASVGPTTATLAGVRAFVEGQRVQALDPSALDAAVEREIHPIDDVRSTGAYRMHVAKALVARAIEG
jgi:CO/xanthine dehydrogenase FAD-binding subunit